MKNTDGERRGRHVSANGGEALYLPDREATAPKSAPHNATCTATLVQIVAKFLYYH